MGNRCDCCKVCCFSTPYGTIFSVSITVVGLVGFLSSAVYGVILVSGTNLLAYWTTIFASVLGSVVGTTFIVLLMTTILSYCVTGYVREEVFHPIIKWSVGGMCNIFVMATTFICTFVWILLGVALSLIMALYLELVWACPQFQTQIDHESFDQCFIYSYKNDTLQVCREGFDDLCVQVSIIIVQSANYVKVKNSSERSYRP